MFASANDEGIHHAGTPQCFAKGLQVTDDFITLLRGKSWRIGGHEDELEKYLVLASWTIECISANGPS
jgi:hypothetical protein